ncbi:hypothetical protein BN1723_013135 [Verticillium longisporum]|uniref:Endoplasmic reticulum oxidoreductin 1 n=1 Tax=Verticillium longisporum TaxID=100787 RepID=A0A0G4LP60_VERLO|nr:hypothetical protein BN1723_013135 [Verticillium longisporum]
MDIDMSRRNTHPRTLSDDERAVLEEYIDSIHYSARPVSPPGIIEGSWPPASAWPSFGRCRQNASLQLCLSIGTSHVFSPPHQAPRPLYVAHWAEHSSGGRTTATIFLALAPHWSFVYTFSEDLGALNWKHHNTCLHIRIPLATTPPCFGLALHHFAASSRPLPPSVALVSALLTRFNRHLHLPTLPRPQKQSVYQLHTHLNAGRPSVDTPAAEDLKQILEAAGRQQALEQIRETHPNTPFVAQTGFEAQDECLEKRVFYRVISGMHASISTHLCWDFLNQTTGQWQPNLACYKTRLHEHPDRISNLYFNYALVTRAVAKLGPFIQGEAGQERYTFCTGDPSEDDATRAKVLAVTQGAASVPQIFDESLMFKNGEGPSLKEDFRNRFRNVSRVMDCVGCDKCRLWGKLQTAGYGTALKVLFEFDNASEDLPQLKRTEIVALFNTYARISSSLRAIGKFRGMVEEQQALEGVSSLAQEAVEPPVGAGAQAQASDADEDGLDDDDYAEEEDEEEEDDEDDEDEASAKKKGSQCGMKSDKNATVSQSLDDELRLVMRVTKLVLVQWASFPGTLWHIVSNETKRFGQFFLGLPVSPRTWKFERPNLDEL